MAFFKFRKAADDTAAAAPAESVEVMRKRARHRLIGAAVLVLIGVVGFPIVFDTQPRPVQVDIPIDIPDRAKAKPVSAAPASAPVTAAAPAPAAPAPTAPAPAAPAPATKVAATDGLDPKEEIVPAKPAAPKPSASASGVVTATPPKSDPKPSAPPPATPPKPDTKPDIKPNDGARAQALLDGKTTPAPAAADSGRYIVQVGAFADPEKARETRLKVERAGLKTYTHVAETREGKRIRVRVGPFASRAEADRAANKIKGLDLPAAILTL